MILIQGGNSGMDFNLKLGKFVTGLNTFGSSEPKVGYRGMTNPKSDLSLGRSGHLAFIDGLTGNLVMFGGSIIGSNYGKTTDTVGKRTTTNNILIYDFENAKVTDLLQFTES
jgi:hypothetical protein